jgi:hypothetical protein
LPILWLIPHRPRNAKIERKPTFSGGIFFTKCKQLRCLRPFNSPNCIFTLRNYIKYTISWAKARNTGPRGLGGHASLCPPSAAQTPRSPHQFPHGAVEAFHPTRLAVLRLHSRCFASRASPVVCWPQHCSRRAVLAIGTRHRTCELAAFSAPIYPPLEGVVVAMGCPASMPFVFGSRANL